MSAGGFEENPASGFLVLNIFTPFGNELHMTALSATFVPIGRRIEDKINHGGDFSTTSGGGLARRTFFVSPSLPLATKPGPANCSANKLLQARRARGAGWPNTVAFIAHAQPHIDGFSPSGTVPRPAARLSFDGERLAH